MFYRKRMKWRRKLRIINLGSVRYYKCYFEWSFKMYKYKGKCGNSDDGFLDRVLIYG